VVNGSHKVQFKHTVDIRAENGLCELGVPTSQIWQSLIQTRVPPNRANWDIRKLTELPNNVLNAFFLNFVQLDFYRKHNQEYYEELWDYLTSQERQRPELRILCVPSHPGSTITKSVTCCVKVKV